MRAIIYRIIILIIVGYVGGVAANAQTTALKTNTLYWLTTTPNIGAETLLSEKWTGSLTVGYNPFSFPNNKKLKHILIQPEARYWLCAPYAGHFVGINAFYSHYNVGGINFPLGIFSEVEDHRYQGDIGAIGLVYGYSWMLNNHWSIEASIGIGYGITHYKEYECEKCGTQTDTETKGMLMPTKIALSLIYYIE